MRRSAFWWWLLVLCIEMAVSALVRADADIISEDQCVVDLELPTGATIRVDGRDYGASRRLTFQPLERGRNYATPFIIHFKDGSEESRTVLVRGGWRVRLILAETNKATPELVPQIGHSRKVSPVAFSPDGSRILTGSGDETAVLWNVADSRRIRTFQGHADTIHCVAFSPNGRASLTVSGDGTIRLWDVATGQEVARLVSLDAGKDWLVVTPEGLFDGSEAGRQEVAFRIGGGLNVVPVDRFFNSFYRPGLLREVIQGQRTLPEIRLGQKLPLILKVVSPKPGETERQEVIVEVEAIDQGGGIMGLSLYNNDARMAPSEPVSLQGRIARRSFRLSLTTGENRLKAKATSGDGAWESEPVEIVLRYEKPLAKSRLYLLCVGINHYADASLNLRYAAPDARPWRPSSPSEARLCIRKCMPRFFWIGMPPSRASRRPWRS